MCGIDAQVNWWEIEEALEKKKKDGVDGNEAKDIVTLAQLGTRAQSVASILAAGEKLAIVAGKTGKSILEI